MNILRPKIYLRLTAIVLLAFSIVLIIFPGFILQILKAKSTPVGSLFIQFLGASLIGTSYLNWCARHFEGYALRSVILMNMASLSPAVVMGVVMMLEHGASYAGVAILLMHLLFLAGFVVILQSFTKKERLLHKS